MLLGATAHHPRNWCWISTPPTTRCTANRKGASFTAACRHLRTTQLRTLLAALGCVLIERLRARALHGTVLACAQVDTLRSKPLKVAVVATRNARRIRLYLAWHRPSAAFFAHARCALGSP